MTAKIIEINEVVGLVEMFTEFMDALYWVGYTEQLADENPERYRFELDQFIDNYNPVKHAS